MKLQSITSKENFIRALKLISRVFSLEEPLTVIPQISEEAVFKYFFPLVESFEECASKGIFLSTMVIDDLNEIKAGFIALPTTSKKYDTSVIEMGVIGDILEALNKLGEKHLFNHDESARIWFGLAAVSPEARGHGFQNQARQYAAESAKYHGFKTILTDCTSPGSIRSMLKAENAFSRASIEYKDFKRDADGSLPFEKLSETFPGYERCILVEEIL